MKKLIVIALLALPLAGCYVTSEGERVGTIIKFSRKGIVWKTWEGQMVLGGSGASANGENVWQFSVDRPELVDAIKKAQRDAQVVTLRYEEELTSLPTRGDTNYYIVDVVK